MSSANGFTLTTVIVPSGPDFTQLFIKAAQFADQYFASGVLPAGFNPGVADCVLTT
jgi:hypothetical protein